MDHARSASEIQKILFGQSFLTRPIFESPEKDH